MPKWTKVYLKICTVSPVAVTQTDTHCLHKMPDMETVVKTIILLEVEMAI